MSSILITDDGPVRTLRINRPEKKNALTLPMYTDMADAIEQAQTDDALRAVIIAGHETGFCAGNDLNDFMAMAEGGGLGEPILRFLHALARSDKPLIAAVRGKAVGIGTTLLFHCDHVVASEDAVLSTPFVALGLVPEAASCLLAPRRMGHARAFSLLVMGQPLLARDAQAAGIINTVVPSAHVDDDALKAARTIAALPREGMLASRRLMRGAPDEIVARIDQEAEAFKARLQSPEAQAAFTAFLTRKK